MSKHYRAFISYSHQDERIASWLQRQLERYRVPTRLRRSKPSLPARLNPVFRDREELASEEDLGNAIQTALSCSDALLVVCSPSAAKSRWVNEEIHRFRSLSPHCPILCILVQGSHEVSSDDCAFPQALLHNAEGERLPEPLAADIRENADGKRGALLKIIAGLLNLGVDELRRRDHQRRVRVLGVATAVASVLAAITLTLAINATRSKNEAELRRTQAENLIDFMLVELRSQLEPIGKLHVLDLVGKQALDYFAALGDLGSQGELISRALALRQIGEVRLAQGQLQPALEAFVQSRALTLSLMREFPESNEILYQYSQAEFWVGYVAWKRKDLATAEQALLAYHSKSLELVRREPGEKYTIELVYAASNLGAVASEKGDRLTALKFFGEAVSKNRELLRSSPDDSALQYDLSEGLSWMGSIHLETGELKSSENRLQEAFNILKQLHSNDIHTRYSQGFGDIANLLGDVQLHGGNLEAAGGSYLVAQKIFFDLVESDAINADWREGYYRSSYRLGSLALLNGELKQAESFLKLAGSGVTELLANNKTNAELMHTLAKVEAHRAVLAVRMQELQNAKVLATRAYDRLLKLIDNDQLLAGSADDALLVLDIYAAVTAAGGDEVRAANSRQYGLSLLGNSEADSTLEKAFRARLLYQLGEHEKAQKLQSELEIIGFNDPRYRTLQATYF